MLEELAAYLTYCGEKYGYGHFGDQARLAKVGRASARHNDDTTLEDAPRIPADNGRRKHAETM